MVILFASAKLGREFNERRALVKGRGAEQAKKIMLRMAQLGAVENLEQLRNQPGHFHALTGDYEGCLAAHLDGNYRLIFEPADQPVPRLADGGLDWGATVTVRILGVSDYHGQKYSKPV